VGNRRDHLRPGRGCRADLVDLDASERSWRRLDATAHLEIWLIGWPVGTHTGWHDHLDSEGAFVTVRGELAEQTWSWYNIFAFWMSDVHSVGGYLTAGSAVIARVSGTTVSDSRVKRRPAPSTDSVHARLGLHLPVGLDVALPPGSTLGTTFSPAARAGLCEPRSPFPGNGILRAEIKAPKQRLDSETPSTETKRARLSPPIGGFLNGDGKSLVARECVVGLRGLELRARQAVLSNRSLSLPQCCKRGRIAPSQK